MYAGGKRKILLRANEQQNYVYHACTTEYEH